MKNFNDINWVLTSPKERLPAGLFKYYFGNHSYAYKIIHRTGIGLTTIYKTILSSTDLEKLKKIPKYSSTLQAGVLPNKDDLMDIINTVQSFTDKLTGEDSPIPTGSVVQIKLYGGLITHNAKVQPSKNSMSRLSPTSKVYKETDEYILIDICPEMVGQLGTVKESHNNKYVLTGVEGKTAWYNREQLDIILRPEEITGVAIIDSTTIELKLKQLDPTLHSLTEKISSGHLTGFVENFVKTCLNNH